ncbi:hypothetical protein A4U53_015980 [Rhizobium ruizarguesonis]|uniref:Uncharacterized protein n=1 Tax=Rhizobium ruizarguesonis TaxID=2081791 RepID=A0ACD5ES42_9HYPH|nr:hypothetical protein [Rhizobium leguminosarum]
MLHEGSCHCGNVAFEVEGEFDIGALTVKAYDEHDAQIQSVKASFVRPKGRTAL